MDPVELLTSSTITSPSRIKGDIDDKYVTYRKPRSRSGSVSSCTSSVMSLCLAEVERRHAEQEAALDLQSSTNQCDEALRRAKARMQRAREEAQLKKKALEEAELQQKKEEREAQELIDQAMADHRKRSLEVEKRLAFKRKEAENACIESNPTMYEVPSSFPFTENAQAAEFQSRDTIIEVCESLRASMEASLLPKVELPTFSGNPLEYFGFMKRFEDTVLNVVSDRRRHLALLMQLCRGKALKLLNGSYNQFTSEDGIDNALRLLKENYGRIDMIVSAHLDELTKGPRIKAGDTESLQTLAAQMTSTLTAFQAYGCESELNYKQFLIDVYRQLPDYIKSKFISKADELYEKGQMATFADLTKFVNKCARENNNIFARAYMDKSSKYSRGKENFTFFAQVGKQRENRLPNSDNREQSQYSPCVACTGSHALWHCKKFKSLMEHDRWALIKTNNLCFNCFSPDHLAAHCTCITKCKSCGKKHHSLLHRRQKTVNCAGSSVAETKSQSKQCQTYTASVTSAGNNRDMIRLKVVPVCVWGRNMNDSVLTYAFLDEGSNATFCTRSLMGRLNLQGPSVTRRVTGIDGSTVHKGHEVELYLRGIDETNVIRICNVLTVATLPSLEASKPTQQVVSNYHHLEGLKFPSLPHEKVEILIGAGVQAAHRIYNVRRGEERQPIGVQTGLGWTIVGPDKLGNAPDYQVHFSSVDNLHDMMEKIYRHDFGDDACDIGVGHSIEDKMALSTMETTVTKRNGHYQIALPWKEANVKLPHSRCAAEKRLLSLRKRLRNDSSLFEKYKAKMDEALEHGHARQLLKNELALSNKSWYIPHHCCTSGKFRVVFDCAAKVNGTSLNDNLLQGPDLTNNLIGVLLRFRQEKIAFMADVKGMFHQVYVQPDDCDALRFLWWPEGNMSKPAADYQMLVHIFGATSSPSCASFALRRTATEHESAANKEAVSTVLHNFYVDDCLKSVPTPQEGTKLVKALRNLLQEGGFHLTKFVSNCDDVLLSVDQQDLGTGVCDMNLEDSTLEKALGVHWDTASDRFVVKVKLKPKPLTRRGLLSTMSQVYDPMGFVQPFILPMKRVMQRLCNESIGWDDAVPTEYQHQWKIWLDELPKLESVSLPRCYKPCDYEFAELHCFCDASEIGYGAVCYLHMKIEGSYHCAFVIGKSRVSPLKHVTIPRLELTAAVVGVKLVQFVKRELQIELCRVLYWTDSTSVLQYLRNTSRRFPTFIANRLTSIQSASQVSQWRHVATNCNPADVASRGLSPNRLDKAKIWFEGPEFLWKDERFWPEQPAVLQTPLMEVADTLKVHNVVLVMGDYSLNILLSHYSSYYRLLRAVSWLQRYKQYMISRHLPGLGKSPPRTDLLSAGELENAALDVVRLVQQHAFGEELQKMEDFPDVTHFVESQHANRKRLQTSTILRKLNPFKVNGIIRVGGRLQHAPIPEYTKHPMVLPSRHHVTGLIVQKYHEREGHSGTCHVPAAIRERYWIVKGQSAVRHYLRDCRKCRLLNAKAGEQFMAPLPYHRVFPGEPPFTHTGVDYFGPLLVKVKRSTEKRWGCLFTCMITRAVHLELANSLDTSTFIQVLRRFLLRRGSTTKRMYSDNGCNFVGTDRELRAEIAAWNKQQICQELCQDGIEWIFNPPAASHQGGVWERMIRSVRKIMRSLTGDRVLDDWSLYTFMIEVEHILNNRPLTPVSDDPRDRPPLKPSELLRLGLDSSKPPGVFVKADYYRKSWRTVQWLTDQFWQRWLRDYLPLLQKRQKWLKPKRNFKVGDVVLVMDINTKRSIWPKGLIEQTFPDEDGIVRRVRVKTVGSLLMRDVRKICLIEGMP